MVGKEGSVRVGLKKVGDKRVDAFISYLINSISDVLLSALTELETYFQGWGSQETDIVTVGIEV